MGSTCADAISDWAKVVLLISTGLLFWLSLRAQLWLKLQQKVLEAIQRLHLAMSNADKARLSLKKKLVDAGEISEEGPKPDSDLEAAKIILRELPTPVFSVLDYRLLWVGFLLGVVAAFMDFFGSGAAHRIFAHAPMRLTVANCLKSSSDPHIGSMGPGGGMENAAYSSRYGSIGFFVGEMERFLFGSGSEKPKEFVPK